ncbi:unnamed protein product [Gordionus sp. m RMFG-2023]
MLSFITDPDISQTIILGNSIIGVSILALPYSFEKSGIVLSCFLFIIASWLNKTSCYLLIKSATLTKTNSYENLATCILGPTGKIITELSIVGFLLGICSAYYIVIGDLVPNILSKWLFIENNKWLRTWTLIIFAFFIILPLSLVDRIDKLNRISFICILFYILFAVKLFFEALPIILDLSWVDELCYWRANGIFNAIPIISLSLTCQTQIFLVYQALLEPNQKRISNVYKNAIDICTSLYIIVGSLGYVAFYKPINSLKGDILINLNQKTLSHFSLLTDLITLGFAMSSALSFPLSLLPCKESLKQIFYSSSKNLDDKRKYSSFDLKEMSENDLTQEDNKPLVDLEMMDNYYNETLDSNYDSFSIRKRSPDDYLCSSNNFKIAISDINESCSRDRVLTLGIVTLTLLIGIFLPNIEVMLGLVGSLMGTMICSILPAWIFLKIKANSHEHVVLLFGVVILIVGTLNFSFESTHSPNLKNLKNPSIHSNQLTIINSLSMIRGEDSFQAILPVSPKSLTSENDMADNIIDTLNNPKLDDQGMYDTAINQIPNKDKIIQETKLHKIINEDINPGRILLESKTLVGNNDSLKSLEPNFVLLNLSTSKKIEYMYKINLSSKNDSKSNMIISS